VNQLLDLSRSQQVLRLLVLLGPVVALLASGPAGHWPPWYVVLVVVGLAAAAATAPESPVAGAGILAVLVWWAAGLDDGLHPAVLVAAAALLVGHVAAVLTSYGPGEMPVDAALVLRWVGRALLVLVPVPLVWWLARALRDQPDEPGVWVVGLAVGLAATVAAGVALTARPQED
jgi:hypothetical protein